MTDKFDFNKGLEELESIIKQMENGDLSLNDSLEYFQKGIEISKNCKKSLQEAEQKITYLSSDNDYQ